MDSPSAPVGGDGPRRLFRGYRYRATPSAAQADTLGQWAGVCRLVWNIALEQRRTFWRHARKAGTPITFASQCRELTQLRAEFDWIAAVPADVLVQTLRDLDTAFARFHRGLARYPNVRRRGGGGGLRFRQDLRSFTLNGKWSAMRLTKLGLLKFRRSRDIIGQLRSVTVIEGRGCWEIACTCAVDVDLPARLECTVGIDRGIANTLSLSTGEHLHLPASIQAIERRRRKAQRVLARRKRGSARHRKQRARVASLAAREGRIRREWLHRQSTDIARRFGVAVIEDLKITNMTASAAGTLEAPGRSVRQKAGLNRAILNQGWYAFEKMLAYKLEERGGTLIKVPAAFTSQTCQACGVSDAQSRESQSVFACVHCGHRDHADTNAALEILRRSTASMLVEGTHQRPVEARTTRSAA